MPSIEKFSDNEIKHLENTKGRIIYNTSTDTIQYSNGTTYVNINKDIDIESITSNITLTKSEQPFINKIGKLQSLEMDGEITGVTSITTNEIYGKILTPNQPNITNIGNLDELTITGKLNLKELSSTITEPKQSNITEVGELENLSVNGTIKINNKNGNCLRIIYNNSNKIFSDINVDYDGNLNLKPTGSFIHSEKIFQITCDKVGFIHKTLNGVELITTIDDPYNASFGTRTNNKLNLITNNTKRLTIDTNGNVGINTISPNKNLSVSGGCIRLIYNNPTGGEQVYVDYEINSYGTVIFNTYGESPSYIFKGGDVHATIKTGYQPYITSVGKLKELNMGGAINNVTNLTAETISGKLLSQNQSNITTIGELTKLQIKSNSPMMYQSTLTNQLFLMKHTIPEEGAYMEIQNEEGLTLKLGIDGKGFNSGDTKSALLSCSGGDLRFSTSSLDRMRINSTGLIGINDKIPKRQLSINSTTGECLRLLYDNKNIYLDCLVNSNGCVIFNAVGPKPSFKFTGGEVDATLSKSEQPNITSVGILSKLELSGEISGVTNIISNTISGVILTSSQPNITSVGKLTKLELDCILLANISSDGGVSAIFKNNKTTNSFIEINNIINNKVRLGINNNDLILENCTKKGGNIKLFTNSIECLKINTEGIIWVNPINCKDSNKQLNINSTTGDCLRMLYNDNNLDINILSNGDSDIITSGNKINIKSDITIGNKDSEYNKIEFNNNSSYILNSNEELLINKDKKIRIKASEYIFQTNCNDSVININNNGNISLSSDLNSRKLNINSITGKCLSLSYNNETELNIDITENGLILFDIKGGSNINSYKFSGGSVDAIISNPLQTNITRLGTLDKLTVSGNIDVKGKIIASELDIQQLNTVLITKSQPNITEIGELEYLNIAGNLNIRCGGNNLKSDNGITVNNINGKCIRMVNNNSKYIDFIVESTGDLNIKLDGDNINSLKQFKINKSGIGYRQISNNNTEFITSISDVNGISIGSYSNSKVNIITNNTSKMTILPNGNIGIGVQIPEAKIDLGNNISSSLIYLFNDSNGIYGFGVNENTILYQSSKNHSWYSNSTTSNIGNELMKLDNVGNLGIGTTSPLYKLHIDGCEYGFGHSFNDIVINTIINYNDKTAGLYTGNDNDLILGHIDKKQLVLSNNGNIGINIDYPLGTLHIKDTNSTIIIESVHKSSVQYKTELSTWEMGIYESFYLSENDKNKLIILPNGCIGINTNTPEKQLCINSDNGECLRLSNNNEAHLDCSISHDGVVTFNAYGDTPKFKFIGGEIEGIISNNVQMNITEIGILEKLEISKDLTVYEDIYCKNISGLIMSDYQPNITSLGVLDSLTVSTIISNFNKGGIIVRTYDSDDLTGVIIKEEIINSIDFSYNGNSFEIIGYIRTEFTELYTFYLNSKKYWLNNKLITTHKYSINLEAGKWYPIYIQILSSDISPVILKWESTSQKLDVINDNSLAWDNHIDTNLRYPINTKDFINIHKLDNVANISIDDNHNMVLTNGNNNVIINGELSATLITSSQPNITEIGELTELVVNGDITGVNKIEAESLYGIIEYNIQPNITSIGTLSKLEVDGDITRVDTIDAKILIGLIETTKQPNITEVGTLTNLNVNGIINSTGMITSGEIKGTIITESQLNITSIGTLSDLNVSNIIKSTGIKFSNNSEIYTKLDIDNIGNLIITSSGNRIITNNSLQIKSNGYGFSHISNNGDNDVNIHSYINSNMESYFGNKTNHVLHLVTSDTPRITIDMTGLVGINSKPASDTQLVINNVKGKCLKLVYNNDKDIYSDLDIDIDGNLFINTSGDSIYTSSQLRIQSDKGSGLSILSPNGLNEYVTNVLNNNIIQVGTYTNTSIGIITNNINRLNIDIFGVVTIHNKINIVSDNSIIKNKEDIDDNFCKEFIKLEPKKYTKVGTDGSLHYGFISQDLINKGYETLTNVVVDENEQILHTVSVTDIIPLLSKNIKILYNENEELKKRLEILEKLLL